MEASKGEGYNTRALAHSPAQYIGREIPLESLQYPEIIQNPLRKLYTDDGKERKYYAMKVNIHVYSSGIIIQETERIAQNKINWFPIQNLYCSAAVLPKKSKGKITFVHIDDDPLSKKAPIFAMVVRQTEELNSNSKRVVMCHAFIVDKTSSAQRLVHATQMAYQNKAGWNHPMNDRQFLTAKIYYTLDKLRDDEEESLGDLKSITLSRDQQLARLPHDSSSPKSRSSAPSPLTPRSVSFHHSASRRVEVASSAPPPRRVITIPRISSASSHMNGAPSPRHVSRIPPQPAIQYHGFSSDLATNGTAQSIPRTASLAGYPVSRSSSQASNQFIPNGVHIHNGKQRSKHGHKSRRQQSAPETPRSHRIIASSEPLEPVNGFHNNNNDYPEPHSGSMPNGNGHIPHKVLMDWEDMLTPAEKSSNGNHQPKKSSRRKYEDYLHGVPNGHAVKGKQEVRPSSRGSSKSDSGYSITNTDTKQPLSNGFSSDHEYADQKL